MPRCPRRRPATAPCVPANSSASMSAASSRAIGATSRGWPCWESRILARNARTMPWRRVSRRLSTRSAPASRAPRGSRVRWPPPAVLEGAVAAVRDGGLPEFRRHHVGHGIGLEAAEAPWLRPGGERLEAGMVLRVEAPYYELGGFGVSVKETVLVTRGGANVVNRSHRGLVVLDEAALLLGMFFSSQR